MYDHQRCVHCKMQIKSTVKRDYIKHTEKCKKFRQHVAYESDRSPRCTICGRNFKNQQGIYGHLARVHFPDFFKDSKCSICGIAYDSKSKHLEYCSKYWNKVEYVDGKWRCKNHRCNKTFDSAYFLLMTFYCISIFTLIKNSNFKMNFES